MKMLGLAGAYFICDVLYSEPLLPLGTRM